MYLLVSLLFILIFYATGFYKILSQKLILFPFLGAAASWVVTAMLIYFGLAFSFWLLSHFSDLFFPQWRKWQKRLTSNIGLRHLDFWFFWLALFFALFFLITNPTLMPLALVLLVAFGQQLK